MDKQLLKQILRDNQQEVVRYMIEPRELTIDDFPCGVLVGVRRSGKSYMLYHRIQQLLREGKQWDEMLYLNFEDERLESFEADDFNRLLECHQEMYGPSRIISSLTEELCAPRAVAFSICHVARRIL